MENHYQKLYTEIIYPAIFGKDYTEPVEEPIEDDSLESDSAELDTSDDTLDSANEYNKNRTRFQQGNKQGVRFAKNEPDETIEPEESFSPLLLLKF